MTPHWLNDCYARLVVDGRDVGYLAGFEDRINTRPVMLWRVRLSDGTRTRKDYPTADAALKGTN